MFHRIVYILLIICVLFATTLVMGQDLEAKLLRLLEENDLDQIYNNLALIKEKFPDQPIPYYVEAFIEKDGDYAVRLYEDFVRNFPTSKYTASARYKIAQYYFLRKSYHVALNSLERLLEKHPDSPLCDDASYLKIRILLAMNRISEARETYKAFVSLYPDSFFRNILKIDFSDTDTRGSKATSNHIKKKRVQYTLQVGAFARTENANFMAQQISNRGYPTQLYEKVVNGKILHLVWVGNFESAEQAEAFSELFKREFDIPLRIVKKE